MDIITLCGDNCLECPRYFAKTDDELKKVAEFWYRVGLSDRIVSNEEIRWQGCYSQRKCAYELKECTNENRVTKCNECKKFPCYKISEMLKGTADFKAKCKLVCSDEEFKMLDKAFFCKEENLKK